MAEIKIDQNLCKGCYICLEICPRKVFEKTDTINEKGFQSLKVFSERCKMACRQCEYLCPEGAITMDNQLPETQKPMKLQSRSRGGWQTLKSLLKPGKYLMSGNEAMIEGALAVGCRFYSGYPITPAREILEGMPQRMKEVGGVFIQMEDEIAAMAAVIGASWTGKKALTATSGPGFSLKQENIGYADMTETPCVIIDVQRAGPSTGQATKPAAGDIMQARYGSHGNTERIVLYPSSVQECYDLTILAFNLAEKFRTPVILLSDAYLAHLSEPLIIKEKIKVFDRIYRPGKPSFGPTKDFSAPSMPCFEDGEHLLVTGSTHDRGGIRKTQDPGVQEALIQHFQNKILKRKPVDFKKLSLRDAEAVIVAYGTTARSAQWAVKEARKKGLKVGLFRPRVLWPFPEEEIKALDKTCKYFVVPEMNQGQLNHVIKENTTNSEKVISLPQSNGQIIDPRRILRFLVEGRW